MKGYASACAQYS